MSARERNSTSYRNWNERWFLFEGVLLIVLCVTSTFWPTFSCLVCLTLLLSYLAFSRINEVVIAFTGEILSRVAGNKRRSTLSSGERIVFLMRSYYGLWINFATLYYFLGSYAGSFSKQIINYSDALYFSGTTITSLGQEGQEVNTSLIRFLSMYEGIAGTILIGVAVGMYIGSVDRDV